MKIRLLLVLAGGVFFSMACKAEVHADNDGYSSSLSASEVLGESSYSVSATLCLASLKANDGKRKISKLSAFRQFNSYPPRPAELLKPRGVKLPVSQMNLASQCLGYVPFEFDVFENDRLRKGRIDDLYPVYSWKERDGYVVIYIYRSYEQEDGEGESIVLSAVTYDSLGQVNGHVVEMSSWYEYEGAVRIRDAALKEGRVIVSEVIYEPVWQDADGRILKYGNTGGVNKIREYVWGRGGYVEQ